MKASIIIIIDKKKQKMFLIGTSPLQLDGVHFIGATPTLPPHEVSFESFRDNGDALISRLFKHYHNSRVYKDTVIDKDIYNRRKILSRGKIDLLFSEEDDQKLIISDKNDKIVYVTRSATASDILETILREF